MEVPCLRTAPLFTIKYGVCDRDIFFCKNLIRFMFRILIFGGGAVFYCGTTINKKYGFVDRDMVFVKTFLLFSLRLLKLFMKDRAMHIGA